MQITFSASGINDLKDNLKEIGIIGKGGTIKILKERTDMIRDRAKQILGEKALAHKVVVGTSYWTGYLQRHITSTLVKEGGGKKGTTIGTKVWVDPAKFTTAPKDEYYAEWVEIGHSLGVRYQRMEIGGPKVRIGGSGMSSRTWWEGYHYLEGAYLEIGPTIGNAITDTLNVEFINFSNKSGVMRSKLNKRLTKGNFVIN